MSCKSGEKIPAGQSKCKKMHILHVHRRIQLHYIWVNVSAVYPRWKIQYCTAAKLLFSPVNTLFTSTETSFACQSLSCSETELENILYTDSQGYNLLLPRWRFWHGWQGAVLRWNKKRDLHLKLVSTLSSRDVLLRSSTTLYDKTADKLYLCCIYFCTALLATKLN